MWNLVGLVKCRYGRDEGGEGGDFMAGKGSGFAVRQWGFWWNMEGGARKGEGEMGKRGGRGGGFTRPQTGWEESNLRREVDFCRRGLHPLEHKDDLHRP